MMVDFNPTISILPLKVNVLLNELMLLLHELKQIVRLEFFLITIQLYTHFKYKTIDRLEGKG